MWRVFGGKCQLFPLYKTQQLEFKQKIKKLAQLHKKKPMYINYLYYYGDLQQPIDIKRLFV